MSCSEQSKQDKEWKWRWEREDILVCHGCKRKVMDNLMVTGIDINYGELVLLN